MVVSWGVVVCLLSLLSFSNAITRYVPTEQATLWGITLTTSASSAGYTGSAAYDPTTLIPPPVPSPAINTQFDLQLYTGGVNGLSIQQHGGFLGFSIEMSVSNQILGVNGTHIQVPFLNLLANVQDRGGRVYVRVGGNSQESAVLVPSLPDGKPLEKDKANTYNPTQTPPLVFTPEILYMMSNISSLLNVQWFLGVPFNDTTNWRLQVVQQGEAILGSNLLGFQAGNEPDLYVSHGNRPAGYGPVTYHNEVGSLIQTMTSQGLQTKNMIIGPNVNADWTPEEVWDTGFITDFSDSLGFLTVEKYPSDNCAVVYNTTGVVRYPQEMLPTYLTHTTGKNLVAPYLNSTAIATAAGKPMLMFETNTASCGGFVGVSDAFAAALWGLDYGLTLAYSNFSGALYHVGGQNAYYNPFTPPPTNQSTIRQWTIGPMYYAVLIMAEIMGKSNVSQVIDLNANTANQYTPAYAIYENGTPTRVALFNYVNDPSGASDLTVNVAIGGGTTGQTGATPASVKVKYLAAASVVTKSNFTWAGQTMGNNFEADGRLQGEETIQTVACDQTANTCAITVPAPGFALVFLSDAALSDSSSPNTVTFPTTAYTKTVNTATVNPSVLATSNGHSGKSRIELGSTSKGSSGGVACIRTESLGRNVALAVTSLMIGGAAIGLL